MVQEYNLTEIFNDYMDQYQNKKYTIIQCSGNHRANKIPLELLFTQTNEIRNLEKDCYHFILINWLSEKNDNRYEYYFDNYSRPEKIYSTENVTLNDLIIFLSPFNEDNNSI